MRAPVHSARMAARDTASTATTAGRDAKWAKGSVRPAACNLFSLRAMMEAVSA